MEHFSSDNQSGKEMEKHRRGSWHPETKFRQEKLLQVGVRTQRIKWECPPNVSLRDEWHVAAGEESVELQSQEQREKSVSEHVYVHPSSIPPNPSIALDLCGESQDDSCIFHVPIEELEEGEVQPPCNSCASSKHASIPANTTSEVDPAVAAISAFAKSVQSELIDPDLLTMFLCNPQLVDQHMKGLAPRPEIETSSKPNHPTATSSASLPNFNNMTTTTRKIEHAEVQSMPGTSSINCFLDECRVLPYVGMPYMVAGHRAEHSSNMPGSKNEQLKKLVNEYGAHESVGHKSFPRHLYSTNMLPIPPNIAYAPSSSRD